MREYSWENKWNEWKNEKREIRSKMAENEWIGIRATDRNGMTEKWDKTWWRRNTIMRQMKRMFENEWFADENSIRNFEQDEQIGKEKKEEEFAKRGFDSRLDQCKDSIIFNFFLDSFLYFY